MLNHLIDGLSVTSSPVHVYCPVVRHYVCNMRGEVGFQIGKKVHRFMGVIVALFTKKHGKPHLPVTNDVAPLFKANSSPQILVQESCVEERSVQ